VLDASRHRPFGTKIRRLNLSRAFQLSYGL